ncbi:MAG TPA: hypothetical protein VIJ59_03480 [Caulobacteraceae bacterium]
MTKTTSGRIGRQALAAVAILLSASGPSWAQSTSPAGPPGASRRDGSRDFDFLIGDWKAHLKRLPERLVGSTAWVEYDGTSSTHKILGSNANMEDFKVDDTKDNLHIRAQTLRLYNPASHQWSVYGLDLDAGVLGLPATVGEFTNGRVELFDYEDWKGRWILVRFVWSHSGATAAHFEQSFSADGGKTWEVNWICDLSRETP